MLVLTGREFRCPLGRIVPVLRLKAEEDARKAETAMQIIQDAGPPRSGAFRNEGDLYEPNWNETFWGPHYG